MRALELRELTGPDGLVFTREAREPEAVAGRLLIDVTVAGVTYPDLLITHGRYQSKPELPYVPGLEVSGVVRSAPADSGFHAGERVAAACMGGGYAETVTAEPSLALRLPDFVSDEAASGLVVNYQTMYFGLYRRAGLLPGETVLVLGAAGGIGVAATQIAVAAGATVIAVCSGASKARLCAESGAGGVIDMDEGGALSERVADITGGRGVDLVVDPVGGDGFVDAVRTLRPEGRILVVGFTGGVPTIGMNRLLLRNVAAVGVAWGAFLDGNPRAVDEVNAGIVALLEGRKILPPVATVWPLSDGAAALRSLEARTVVGKAALRVR